MSGTKMKRPQPSVSVKMTILRTLPIRSLTVPQNVMAKIATAQAMAFNKPKSVAGKPMLCR